MKALSSIFLLSALLLASGCLSPPEPNLPSMPLANLNLQVSDAGHGFALVDEGQKNFLERGTNLSLAKAYYRQFMLPPSESGQDRPFQVISMVTEFLNTSMAREMINPERLCPSNATPPTCSDVYQVSNLGDEAYVFEDFKSIQMDSGGGGGALLRRTRSVAQEAISFRS
ncbi:MAG: hypothetical protein M1530_03330 [Candidatus Marsarchaeota archaeon]|nr:hypothetical protein [Candidatus Marsarchaeota archaeon]